MINLGEKLREIPFLRFSAALLAGILWQATFPFTFDTLLLTLLLALIYFGLFFLPFTKKYNRQWIAGSSAFLFLFFTGVTLVQQQATESSLPMQQPLVVYAKINDTPSESGRFVKLQVSVKAYADSSGTLYHAREKIFIYIAPDSSFVIPKVGAHICVRARMTPIPPPQNPSEFDYKTYLSRKKIFSSAFVQQADCEINHTIDTWDKVQYFPLKMQQKALHIFEKSAVSGDQYAVLAALTLGNKQLLDDDLRTSYVSAGAMHLLAVSGLHVGIIMVVLGFFFSFLGKKRNGIYFKNGLIILCLWFYAAVVGFSPSVTRATVMFTFVLLGQMSRRHISIYNSLAASAFFLCVCNPLLLFDVGFQLSYLAVLSIVYFQPKIYHLWYLPNKYLDKIWVLATVSIAAQIGTLPVSLYYFHQFPNYFLLTNIAVISLTGFIVYTAVAFLMVNAIPILSDIVGFLLNAMLTALNTVVRFVEALPYSVSTGIYINSWQALLLTVIVLAVAVYTARLRRMYLWVAAYSFVLLIGISHIRYVQQKQQEIFVVYNVKNSSFIHFVNGHASVALRDSGQINNSFSFNLGNYFTKKGIRDIKNIALSASPLDTLLGETLLYRDFVIFNRQLIKILGSEKINRHTPTIHTDYLVVTSAASMFPDNALKRYRTKQIILDSSVPFYRAKQWKKAAETAHVPLYNVRESGAFICQK